MATGGDRIASELHDEPHIAGRRIAVLDVRDLVEERGLPAAEVADRYGLEVAEVYAVLTYYHDNAGEMNDAERRRREARERSLDRGAATADEIVESG